jgi:hypothetical protein
MFLKALKLLGLTWLLASCSSINNALLDCSVNKASIKAIKAKIDSEIDSVYRASTLKCDKLKKIIYSKCIDDSIFDIRAHFEIKAQSQCNDYNYKYLYFNNDFAIIKVMDIIELPEVH